MNNQDKKKNSGTLWMMLICCMLPLVILLFVENNLFSGGYLWPILISVFMVAHVWMMFKGYGKYSDGGTDEKVDALKQPKTKDEHKHGGCCQ